MGGFSTVMRDANALIQCNVFEGFSFDERLREFRTMTMDYRPSKANRELSGTPPGGSDQTEASNTEGNIGGLGGSGPMTVDGKGKGVASYCNKGQQPTVCLLGFSCFTKALANQAVLWGLTKDRFNDFIGMCAVTVKGSL